jgi:cytochrome c oxidase subunit 3
MPSGVSDTQLDAPRLARGGPGGRGPGGDGPDFHGGGGDSGGGDHRFSPGLYQVGVIVALFSIASLFIALVLAYGIQLGRQSAWQKVRIPMMLWVSTGLLAASSVALEVARRSLRFGLAQRYIVALRATTALGIGFIGSQLVSWLDLKQQGIFLSANLHGSMFYIFTGAHGLHVLVGILCLIYLSIRSRKLEAATEQVFRHERSVTSAVALYWHFMGVLWIALFGLLHLWS